jgi:glycosyltransferase involved in cell wall biosynthesis
LKIALLTQHFAPDFEGGTEAVVRAQARELVARGHEVLVVSGTDVPHSGADVWPEEVDGVRVFFLPRRPGEYMDLALDRPRVEALVERLVGESDVVHVHHWATLTGSLVRHFSPSRPVVVTLHDYFLTCPRYFRLPPKHIERCPERGAFDPCVPCVQDEVPTVLPEHIAEGFVLRERANQAELNAADAVIVPSRTHAAGLRRFLDIDESKLFCVPHGTNRALTRLDVPEWRGEGRLRVLFLGHRSEVKGVHDFAAALAELPPDKRERIEWILLGDEMAADFDLQLIQLAGDARISFVGNYTTDTVDERIAEVGAAHLGVFPSRAFESYGLVPDELWACGLPVWVSDRGAPKERIGAAGRVLPAADPRAWASALAEVLEDPDRLERERRSVPERARTCVEAVLELEEIYGSLLGG